MLGKLLKYDFKSTSRIMWILYLGIIVVGALMGISLGLRDLDFGPSYMNIEIGETGWSFQDTILTILSFAFVILIQAVAVITTVMIILRFYRNLLGDEGYLMHTLPVKTEALICSKLIISIFWVVVGVVSSLIAALLLGLFSGFLGHLFRTYSMQEIMQYISEFLRFIGVNFWTLAAMAIITLVSSILIFYAAMAIGNLANRNKFLFAVLAYLGIQILMTVIFTITEVSSATFTTYYIDDFSVIVDRLFFRQIILQSLLGIGAFVTTDLILKKKLNLA